MDSASSDVRNWIYFLLGRIGGRYATAPICFLQLLHLETLPSLSRKKESRLLSAHSIYELVV